MNNTLLKGLAVLELLSRTQRPMNLVEIAAQLGIVKSHAHGLMQALLATRYVIRQERGYIASIKLWTMGSAVLSGLDLKQRALPIMNALLEETGERVHLSVLDSTEVVFIHKVERTEPENTFTQIGGRVPAHMLATGKVQIAHLGKDLLTGFASALDAATPRTIVKAASFMREMKKVREQGFAVNCGEWRESVWGVGAPIFDADRRVIGAIGFSGPPERMKRRSLTRSADIIIASSIRLSESTGQNAELHSLLTLGSTRPRTWPDWVRK